MGDNFEELADQKRWEAKQQARNEQMKRRAREEAYKAQQAYNGDVVRLENERLRLENEALQQSNEILKNTIQMIIQDEVARINEKGLEEETHDV